MEKILKDAGDHYDFSIRDISADNKLNFILPFIKDKVSKVFFETENKIEAIILKEYTSIHPSVKWRFQEEAIHLSDRDYLL
ncbi:hypothetical protein [Sphingobacterium athyrii]|uniref:Uncharacterized protein n=1 Tax=Sphingobacterium athyrii TaxID=2152717 RepID=A0A363NYC1_9SPHI|nr:hypothetical protein [Sphingobacterium athyrii]PUV25708.1 hypothetical protein DCO56_01630 [Sphingobacterium athyrii]